MKKTLVSITAAIALLTSCSEGADPIPLPTTPKEDVFWLEYNCEDGRIFWVSDLGFSFESEAGPWTPLASTEGWSFEEVCGS